jgi:broad specificity phosphatase PhoE
MTLIFLVRHAAHDSLPTRLSGRLPGIRLGETGRAQAEALAAKLANHRIDTMHSSPRERCLETAAAIASAAGASAPEISEALDEVDFGAWSGREFAELDADPVWSLWNEQRSLARTPGGESALDVQRRIMSHIERVASLIPNGAAVLVSHAEPIRAALLYVLGCSLDAWSRLEISPASISRILFDAYGARVCGVNETAD